ncbi:MAG: TIGR02281 family clan AA aspartic protease [Nitrosomonadales bacterium]|nr:TIGR02281 family clan AA aspartic protease [Nitrosomonadales bacterium]
MSAALILILPGGNASAAAVYKCKNQQGNLIYQESPCKPDVQAVSSWGAAEMQQLDGMLVLKQRGNGHYFLEATVNDKSLTLLVDTGASGIALPMSFALSAKMSCRNKIYMQTANGVAEACTAIISRLMFGPFTLTDVPAVVSKSLSQPLFGMNVLQQFKVEQNDGEMRISTRN